MTSPEHAARVVAAASALMRTRSTLDLGSAALAIALLAGCGGGREATTSRETAPSDTLRPTIVPASAQQVLAAASAPGARATLVNVWASWCAPCREEFPALLAVARAHRADGLRLVLVSADFDDQLTPARRFLRAHGYDDTSFVKTGDDMAFIQALEPRWSGALPATLVYDARGRQVAFWEGMADHDRFEKAVGQALGGGTP